jgi:hypothetical protein
MVEDGKNFCGIKSWTVLARSFSILEQRHSALHLKLQQGNNLILCSVTQEIPVGTNEILSTKLLKLSVKREISEQLFWKHNKVSLSPETRMYQNAVPGHYITHLRQQ